MEIGDIVINKYRKCEGVGMIIENLGRGESSRRTHYRVYWPGWGVKVVMHEFLLEVISECR
jgi:hypothetical protein